MKWPILLFAWRNLWRYPKRSGILLSVSFLGLTAILFFNSLMLSWANAMLDNALNNLGAEWQIQTTDFTQNPDLQQRFILSKTQQIALQESTLFWAGRLNLPAIVKSEYESLGVNLLAVDLQQEATLSFIGNALQDPIKHFNDPQKPYQIIVGQALLERINSAVGRKLVVLTQGKDGKLAEIGLRISASFRHSDPNIEKTMVFMPLSTAQKWLAVDNQVNQIALKNPKKLSLSHAKLGEDFIPQIETLKSQFSEQKIISWRDLQPYAFASISMMDSFNWVWLAMIGVLMLFALLNTLYMSLYERRTELQRLFILGLKPSQLRRLLLLELLAILLLSALFSWGFMFALVSLLSNGINLSFLAEGTAWIGISHQLFLGYDYGLWLNNTGQLIVALSLFAALPIWRATRFKNLQQSNQRI
ncbi:ABC transporter permease [Thiosulfatimonas sediminis]|uniref:ABC transporter permease n=1 Tax=Thiosulfatimonas sediminis TaxID=2675054 RepID=A0A6F8PRT5_9GAMM|nr:FtsX-like permease family protein [Thiosulfatimonas sediminis]BBP44700.1 ABC transporter permease [Thiosulfatimonas sediminis]